jgi:tripartite-type tricarboxylate transporter receptor subunit TctC
MSKSLPCIWARLRPAMLSVIAAAILFGASSGASAQAWPGRVVTIVVGSGPGSAPDTIARTLAEPLGRRLGTTIVVENRAGATGSIGAAAVARATPDASTLLMMTAAHTITPLLTPTSQFDPERSFTAVAHVASVPLLLVANPNLGARSLTDLVRLMRARPGQMNFSSPGIGSIQHFATTLILQSGGLDAVHVPYRSGDEAVMAVLSRNADFFFAGMPPALPHVREGRLVALAVSTAERAEAAPDVRTLDEQGYPGMVADNWHALVTTVGAPTDRVAHLAAAVGATLAEDEVRQRLLRIGAQANFKEPAILARLISSEVAKWREVAPAAGLGTNR